MAGDLSCFFLHLGPNSSTTITVTYEVPATTDAGTITNEATVASTEDSDTDDDTVVVVEDVDLEIAKSFADDEVTAGAAGTHTFSLLVENLGDSDADNVTVVDAAPAGLTFISEDSPNCAIVAGDLSCFFLHLGPNSSTTITVTYEVPATTDAGTITKRQATVASTEDSDTDDDTVVVVEDVDLEIAKSFADDEVTAGAAGTHTFSLLVENLGDSDADNVTVVDAAPAGLTFMSEDSPNCAIVAGDLSCFFLHLGPNSSTTITVTYEVPATTDAGTITNEATVASTEDSDTDDDTVVVVEDVDLEIAKSFADDEVTAGAAGTHTFSLLVENLGDSDADNVTVVDAAPAGLTFIGSGLAQLRDQWPVICRASSCFSDRTARRRSRSPTRCRRRTSGGHDHQRGDRRLHRGQRHR